MQEVQVSTQAQFKHFTHNDRVIKLRDVIELTGLKKTSIYNLIKKNEFPKQITLARNSVGWVQSEVLQWVNDLMINRDLLH
ncbi:AlpA family transcriptional regulator [Shewanella gelidimarina]|uniref:AlpA family transcriptional regulator n=1 Tax=Shewanella gelidimarina TaxID=56813 RepID=UPI00200D12FA|nr:AlpA family transcriptional regulator [Shewanella gelidimarina]MCL1059743.1 AlpA family transcriptional regulator [Shewanella gelidimarina]